MPAALKMVTTQIPESVFGELETYAKELDRSKSWLVRKAIVDMLANRKKTQQNNESEWDELFDFIRQANESGEDMEIELPPRENVWKPNPILETDWGDMADDAKN
ncbi:MAG: hypothetical protein IJ187_06180 [Neisseriaceae bacterium]|nr:hypothetical protein [Neisseriaceae bacterium]MBR1818770.1 hypothetical protein [Neisseriaceae bacterium]